MLSRRAFLPSAVAERETGRLQQPCHLCISHSEDAYAPRYTPP
jgi:hypothetical protein